MVKVCPVCENPLIKVEGGEGVEVCEDCGWTSRDHIDKIVVKSSGTIS